MSARLQPVLRWWKERNLRERLLVMAGATAIVLVAGDLLVTAPAEKRVKSARLSSQSQQVKLDKLRDAAASSGDSALQQRLLAQRLQQRVQIAQAEALMIRQQAAQAARLPETLRAITATVGSARLLILDLAGDAAQPPGASAIAPASGAASAVPAGEAVAVASLVPTRLYRLPITLKVSGTYEELHMLLTQIERHAEALQWSSLTLDSSEWPAIQLTLKAHVLSPDPRWGAAS